MTKALLEQAGRLQRAGQWQQAAALCQQVLSREPRQPQASLLLGLIAQQHGQHAQALTCFTATLGADPGLAAAHLLQGLSLRALDRATEALAAFRAALGVEPKFAEAYHQLGNTLKHLRRFPEAIANLRQAAQLSPGGAPIWLNLGVAQLEIGQTNEAIASFQRGVDLAPANPDAHTILGHALLVQGRCGEARRHFAQTLRLRPNDVAAHNNLGRLYKTQGRLTEAVASYRAALAAGPNVTTHSNLLLVLNYLPDLSPVEVFAEHRRWAQRYAALLRQSWPAHDNNFSPNRRVRLGYVSADFINHSVAYFFEPVLTARDRQQFEVFCYSDVECPDRVTERLRASADHWRDVAGQTDQEVAKRVREDRIDILIDLAGHTARHRLLVFARKPAPVQVTWLGYPNTTGLDAIDYRVTEAVCDPVGRSEADYAEHLLRLPETFLCYRPSDDSPPVSQLPALADGSVTFGCFNNLAKVTTPVLDLWTQLLRELPTARLLLRSRGLTDPETVTRLREHFARGGVVSERLEFSGEELSVSQHLSCYHRVDIALDTFPYNGTTTTCEALWMGVPVVTLAGQTHAARVGASLLTHLGSPEWVAEAPEAYLDQCRQLAADLTHLAQIRRQLRARMWESPLCDAPRFVRHFEHALRGMWLRRCAEKTSHPAALVAA